MGCVFDGFYWYVHAIMCWDVHFAVHNGRLSGVGKKRRRRVGVLSFVVFKPPFYTHTHTQGTAVFVLLFNSSSALTSYLKLAFDHVGGGNSVQTNFLIFLGAYAAFGLVVMLPSSLLWPGRRNSGGGDLEEAEKLLGVNDTGAVVVVAESTPRTSVWADIVALPFRGLLLGIVLVTAIVGLNIKFALGAMAAEVEGPLGTDAAVKLATQFSWFSPISIMASGLMGHFLVEGLRKCIPHRMEFILWVLIFGASFASMVVLALQTVLIVECPSGDSCSNGMIQGFFWGSNILNLFVWNTLYVFVLSQIHQIWPDRLTLVFSLAMVLQVITVACASGLLYWGLISFVQPNAFLLGLTFITLVVLFFCIQRTGHHRSEAAKV